jgi:hypothetical protein
MPYIMENIHIKKHKKSPSEICYPDRYSKTKLSINEYLFKNNNEYHLENKGVLLGRKATDYTLKKNMYIQNFTARIKSNKSKINSNTLNYNSFFKVYKM